MSDELTTDYLVTFARDQQREAYRREMDRLDQCPTCAPHSFHGLPCTREFYTDHGHKPCPCRGFIGGEK